MDHCKRFYVCEVDEIPLNKSKAIKVNNNLIAIFRTGESEFYGIENSCPHAGVPLDNGILNGKEVACLWHNWIFDLESGESPTCPGVSVRTFPLLIEDNKLFIQIKE